MRGISASNKMTGLYSKDKYVTTFVTNCLKLLNIHYVQKITPKMQLKLVTFILHIALTLLPEI